MIRRMRACGRATALLALALASVACAGVARRPAGVPDRRSGPDLPELLVTLPPGPPSAWEYTARELAVTYGLYVYRAWKMPSLGVPCIVYGVPPGESIERLVRRLGADHRVESVELVQSFEVLGSGGDPYAALQTGALAMRAAEAHRWATGRGVRVAVVDTGVDISHPDLSGRVVAVGNFVDPGGHGFTADVHGTAVTGIVAAVAGNGIGIAGIAPDAEIVALKACWSQAPAALAAVCDSYTLVQAVDSAIVGGARVINLSLAGPEDPLLARLIRAALARGIAVVAAGDVRRADLGFPASLPGVIAVIAEPAPDRAVAPTGVVTAALPAANAGRALVAPGTDVLTTVPGGGYDFLSGSSMAAAFVTGVAALLLERDPRLAPAALARLLGESTGEGRPAVQARTPAGAEPPTAPSATGGRVTRDLAISALAAGTIIDACAAVAHLLELASDACPGGTRAAR